MHNLSRKVVLVSSGSKGLGSITWKELAVSGAKEMLHYINNEKKENNLKK